MGKLSKKINEAKNVNLDDQEIEGMIEKVKDELESAKNNIEPMIRKMKEKISHYGCDFQLAVNNEQRENEKKEHALGNGRRDCDWNQCRLLLFAREWRRF